MSETILLPHGEYPPLPIDAVLDEEYSRTLSLTEYPVESGASLVDHAFNRPNELRLTIRDGLGPATFTALDRLKRNAVRMDVITGLDVHRGVVLDSIDASRDLRTSSILAATLHFREVEIANTAVIDAQLVRRVPARERSAASQSVNPAPGTPQAAQAATPVSTGDSVGDDEPLDDGSPEAERNRSLLHRVLFK